MSGAKNSHDENSKRQLKAVRPSLVNYYLIFSSNHNVLGPIRRHRLLVPFFWMFFNERTIPIRVVAALLRPFALFVVTARWLVGKKEKEWTSEVRERLLREQIAEDRGSDQPK